MSFLKAQSPLPRDVWRHIKKEKPVFTTSSGHFCSPIAFCLQRRKPVKGVPRHHHVGADEGPGHLPPPFTHHPLGLPPRHPRLRGAKTLPRREPRVSPLSDFATFKSCCSKGKGEKAVVGGGKDVEVMTEAASPVVETSTWRTAPRTIDLKRAKGGKCFCGRRHEDEGGWWCTCNICGVWAFDVCGELSEELKPHVEMGGSLDVCWFSGGLFGLWRPFDPSQHFLNCCLSPSFSVFSVF